MNTIARRCTAAAVVVLTLVATSCGDDGGGDDAQDGTDASESTVADAGESSGDDGADSSGDDAGESSGDDVATGSANPCDVITQEQWEVLFGAGVTKGDASGGADNCNVLTSGASPGHEVALSNFSASFETTFDDQVAAYAGCDEATVLDGVGDQAIIDTSCLAIAGSAWVIVDDGGDILLVSYDVGEPSTADLAAVEATLTTITQDMLAAR